MDRYSNRRTDARQNVIITSHLRFSHRLAITKIFRPGKLLSQILFLKQTIHLMSTRALRTYRYVVPMLILCTIRGDCFLKNVNANSQDCENGKSENL